MKSVVLAGLGLSVSLAATASASEPEVVSVPSAGDYIAAEAVARPVLDSLVAGDTKGAMDKAFSGSPLLNQMGSQIQVLIGQADTILGIYGPIAQCELAQRDHFGSLLVRLAYVCQHESFLTRWDIRVQNTAGSGWVISQVNFEDAK